ncbi:4-hydroxy-3-methylbut-2-enyl diphosphate reductase [Treponema pectinovorum]|uniref:4-hydroxy-3-methylbut-2-enyl diphosphate reductase n=1 Tax=Treponema pectinovorum TaxID=164 RepID=UPI003D92ADB3
MKIIRAEKMGFCAGVRRAVMTANNALSEKGNGKVYTFGPLIHNPVALKKFEENGLEILSEENISILKKGDTVVIRAHGISPEIQDLLEKTGAKILNGTCPIVQKNQKKCCEYAKNGYVIFFTGDKNHGEVVGIEGAAKKGAFQKKLPLNFILIKSVEEALEKLGELEKNFKIEKSVLISQTTFSVKVFEEIAASLKTHLPNIEVIKSICPATYDRQDSLDELCSKVEGVLVIGGKSSANTNRLYDKALKLCNMAALIEDASEIPEVFFKLKVVGLTAGASTPDDVIDEVEKALQH